MENIYTTKESDFITRCLQTGFDDARKQWIDDYIQQNVTPDQLKNPLVASTWQETAEKEFTAFHKTFRGRLREINQATTPKREKKSEADAE